ncbi:MAG: hypothetical protein M1823_008188, partial [Watsoniomyces obsoletus]
GLIFALRHRRSSNTCTNGRGSNAPPHAPPEPGALRSALETALPPGSWQLESSVEPARWIVYMGKYSNDEALAKKRAELRQLGATVVEGADFIEVTAP